MGMPPRPNCLSVLNTKPHSTRKAFTACGLTTHRGQASRLLASMYLSMPSLMTSKSNCASSSTMNCTAFEDPTRPMQRNVHVTVLGEDSRHIEHFKMDVSFDPKYMNTAATLQPAVKYGVIARLKPAPYLCCEREPSTWEMRALSAVSHCGGLWEPNWDQSQRRRPVSAYQASIDASLCTCQVMKNMGKHLRCALIIFAVVSKTVYSSRRLHATTNSNLAPPLFSVCLLL